MPSRLRRALALAPILVAIVSGPSGCSPPRAEPRNVLLIVVDTLRPDHLSHQGHPHETSPHLDALAAESWAFEDAQSAAPWTAPALLSLMTSRYPEAHGVVDFPNPGRMADAVPTLAEVLRAAGFRTAAFTEGGYAKGVFGLDQGFELYPSNPGDAESHSSNLLHPSRIEANVDRALAWLDGQGEAPFLLFFHTYEPHYPYRAPAEVIRDFRPGYSEEGERAVLRAIGERWNGRQPLTEAEWDRLLVHQHHCQLLELPVLRDRAKLLARVRERVRDFEAGHVELSADTLDFLHALYDAELRFTDAELGRLLEGLEDAGHGADTVVVVTSDHGEGLGQHRRIQHGTNLFDELTRALLLLRVPGQPPRRVESLVRTIDLAPTLLAVLGLPPPAAFAGESLVGDLAAPRLAYTSARARTGEELRWRALRSDRFTLLADDATGAVALYDRAADPGETQDVAHRFPEAVAALRASLETIVAETRGRAAGSATKASPLTPEE